MTTPDPVAPPASIPVDLRSRAARARFPALIGAWALLVVAGWVSLHSYQAKAGPSGAAVEVWPTAAPFARAAGRPTLILVAHPDCPCTLATIDELARLTERLGTPAAGKIDLHVLFYSDPEFDAEWRRGTAWSKAAALPRASPHADPLGRFARAFGVQTSGHVLLFAADGRRLFSGGITPSRGEHGDSPGADAILALLTKGETTRTTSSVFGCLLWADDDATGAS
jgi:hypothetical protein